MNKNRILLAFSCAVSSLSFAQSDVDALRYSMIRGGGTARAMSMGGAFGALGADFSALSGNPAGIALYRKSEFTFTPSLFKEETISGFQNNSLADSKYNFNFSNAGFVLASKRNGKEEVDGWQGWAFGFGYNKLNNFHSRFTYEGNNSTTSMTEYFAEMASGIYPSQLKESDPFWSDPAFQTYLISPDSVTNDSAHYLPLVNMGGVMQRRSSTTRGSMGEMTFSFGGNYNEKLYLGASVGFPTIRYKEEVEYQENDNNNFYQVYPNNFKSLTINEYNQTSGTGFNFKFGIIARPADFIRIGAAVHTPTFYTMTDEYSTKITSVFDSNNEHYTKESPAGSFDYTLTTPLKTSGSIALIFGKSGAISADYEMIDYSDARLRSSSSKFFSQNDAIQKKYTQANNLRLGAEWKYQQYSFRAGYALLGSPFKPGMGKPNADMSVTNYSAGFGIRDKGYFMDFAYVFSKQNDFFRPYSLSGQSAEGSTNTRYTYSFMLTMGARF